MENAVDALRGSLLDNPLVLIERPNNTDCEKYFFSDWDLLQAIHRVIPHLPKDVSG